MENLYRIRREDTKISRMKFVPVQGFLFDWAESKGWRGLRGHILKSRKASVTTFFSVAYLDETIMRENVVSLIMAHKRDDLEKLFRIVRLAYKKCPKTVVLDDGRIWRKPKARYDNANELFFSEINSTIYVALESRGSSPTNLHVSEAAHIDDPEMIKATLGGMRDPRTNITFETTANGQSGDFFEKWEMSPTYPLVAEDGYTKHFFGWWQDPQNVMEPPEGWQPTEEALAEAEKILRRAGHACTPQQLYFWALKKKEQGSLLRQEFPAFADEAFMVTARSVFDADGLDAIEVMSPLRTADGMDIYREPEEGKRYVMIVDPAGGKLKDEAAITVIDADDFGLCAEYGSNAIGQVELGHRAARVGRMYNTALSVVENVNSNGLTVIRTMMRPDPGMGDPYPRGLMYRAKPEAKANATTSNTYGFVTHGSNRDMIIAQAETLVRDRDTGPLSAALVSQMRTFVCDDVGRKEAATGKKDDRLIVWMIGRYVARLPRRFFGTA